MMAGEEVRREKKGKTLRESLYGQGMRLKFLHTNEWKQPWRKRPKEERVKKEKSRGTEDGRKFLPRALAFRNLSKMNVSADMIDRYDWGRESRQTCN